MIATKIVMRTIFVENFMQNIFCNMKFFSKMHISRENEEIWLQVHVSTPTAPKRTGLGTWAGSHGFIVTRDVLQEGIFREVQQTYEILSGL